MSKDQFNPAADDVRDGAGIVHDLPTAAENKEAERFSPEALMHKERIIIVAGEVNDQLAYRTNLYVKHLEAIDPDKPITLLVNSPGGSVLAGLSMVDIIRQCKCPIKVVGTGLQASMGSILLAIGDTRFMTPNSTLMIHQIMSGNRGGTQASDLEIALGFTTNLHERLKNIYVEFSGLTHEYWDIVMERDTYLSAEQALKMGFIDGITVAGKDGGRYAAEASRTIADPKLDTIAQMGKAAVLKALGTAQANQGEWGRYRPALVTRLSEFPEYWTKERRAEAKLEAAAKAPSNDDNAKPRPAAKKPGAKPAA